MGKKRKISECGDAASEEAGRVAKIFPAKTDEVDISAAEETELGLYDRLQFIKKLKKDVRSEGILFESEEHHHHVFGYQNIGRLESVLSRMHSRRLLKYSAQSRGVIIAFGKIILSNIQPIYSIHPYLHVDYKVQCMILKANKSTIFETKIESVNGANAFSTFLKVPVVIEGVQEEDEVIKGFSVKVLFKKFSYDDRSSIIRAKVAH